MIFDRLENAALYEKMHPLFPQAFEFLRNEARNREAGKHVLDGERLYVLIATAPGRGHDGAKLEAHRRYIDIQYVLKGTDDIGLKPTSRCEQVELEYDPKLEVALFLDKPTDWISVPEGSFTIFYPDDAHAPLGSTQETTKAVVKVEIGD